MRSIWLGISWALLPSCSLFLGDALARQWVIQPDGLGDAVSIQAGIDSASSGDTILALPGRYVENIDFKGKAITVKGSGKETTIIDGSGAETTCVLFINGEGRESVLTGFTITFGSGYLIGGTFWGGGIYGWESEPTLRDNVIERNEAVTLSGGLYNGRGGGVYFASAGPVVSPVIEQNIIRGNHSGGNGGGVGFRGAVSPVVRGNVLLANESL